MAPQRPSTPYRRFRSHGNIDSLYSYLSFASSKRCVCVWWQVKKGQRPTLTHHINAQSMERNEQTCTPAHGQLARACLFWFSGRYPLSACWESPFLLFAMVGPPSLPEPGQQLMLEYMKIYALSGLVNR